MLNQAEILNMMTDSRKLIKSCSEEPLDLKLVKLPEKEETLLFLGWIWTTNPFFHATSKTQTDFTLLDFSHEADPPDPLGAGSQEGSAGKILAAPGADG